MAQNKISPDLIPTINAQRTTGAFGYFNIWIGLAIIIATFAVGGESIAMVNLQQVILASFLGCLLLGAFITITGDVGMEHGISFPVYIRALLGPRGTIIPNIIRPIYGAIWFGVQTYFGAIAINLIVKSFLGFDNWLIWFIIFAAVQIINTAFGFKAMEKFATIAAPTIILIGIYMTIKLFNLADDAGIQVWNTIVGSPEMTASGTFNMFVVVMILNMCYWADATAEVETWTRYIRTVPGEKSFIKRNKTALAGHLLGLPIAETFMVFIGALSLLVVNNYNPVEAMQSMTNSPVILSLLLLMVIFAQWSTNSTGNLLPGAINLVALLKSKVKYPIAVLIVGVLGCVIRPWVILDNISVFLAIIGSLWSSFFGMTVADYYVIRKRRLNVPDLYVDGGGQFYFSRGWNLAGITSLACALVACFFFSSYSFFVGFGVAFVMYLLTNKYWYFKKYPQVEFTVSGDEMLGTTAGRDWLYDEEKNIIYPSK